MNRYLLFRFFDGKTTAEEDKMIEQWLKVSDENLPILLAERNIYDALLLMPGGALKKKNKSIKFFPWVISISTAASLLLLFYVGRLFFDESKSSPEQFNAVITPFGQFINIILSDSTNVWLNGNTTLHYPSQFSEKERVVFLDGEAFFDVVNKLEKSFIVNTNYGEIRVMGTSFNVTAYSDSDFFETSLFEGGVEIYKNDTLLAQLHPDEKVTIADNKFSVSEITNYDDYLWRKGLIGFNDEKLEKILMSLGKYFNVDIEILTDKLSQHTYTGKFRQSDGAEYALRILQKNVHFSFEKDIETGIIYIQE